MAKIGLIQVPPPENLSMEEKHDIMYTLAENCLKEEADIVLFPEGYQYTSCRDIVSDSQLLTRTTAEWKTRLSELAKKYNAYLAPWDYYTDEDGKNYNSTYILDRNGEEVGRYLKCNITIGEMSRGVATGCDYPVFDLDFGKVGIMICFDNYFPESAAALANRGAQLILYPLYGDTLKPEWEMKMIMRTIDHSLYVVSCQLDRFYDIAYTGIVAPGGEVIAKLDKAGTWHVVDIDMDKKVFTNTLVVPGRQESIRDYLHKCRNYKAFSSLAEEGTPPKEWDEIYRYNN